MLYVIAIIIVCIVVYEENAGIIENNKWLNSRYRVGHFDAESRLEIFNYEDISS